MQNEPVDGCHGAPRRQRFDDIYRNRYDALAQARSVFLQGCQLPERWQNRASYSVAGAVHRRLAALGFAVHKRPGLPPKRERLQAEKIIGV